MREKLLNLMKSEQLTASKLAELQEELKNTKIFNCIYSFNHIFLPVGFIYQYVYSFLHASHSFFNIQSITLSFRIPS